MNNSLVLWLVGGVAVALGLLLAFSVSAPVPESAVEVSEAPTASEAIGSEGAEVTYWEPVVVGAATSQAVSVYPARTAGACAGCGTLHTDERPLVGGCFPPDTPCGNRDCPICPRMVPTAIAVPVRTLVRCTEVSPCGQPGCPICAHPVAPAVCGGCERVATVCGLSPCESVRSACGRVCPPVCSVKPGINRNVPACIDECAFLQLNATLPQPVCGTICYRWEATRGTFINPTARDPLYFAPAVQLPCGEDVLITLTIVDAGGARYSDEIRLHVRNLP